MKQYEMYERVYMGVDPGEDWVNINIEATFELNGNSRTIKGFYAGNGTYKVRYLPMEQGRCTFKVRGIVEDEGELMVEPADKDIHGPVYAEKTYFRYADGNFYLPFGTTVYALPHQETALIEQTLRTLSQAPFNKIRFCIFPKDFLFNKNEPEEYAFEKKRDGSWNVLHPNMKFFDRLDQYLERLNTIGIQADVILFHPYDRWGFSQLTKEECMNYLEYMIRRIAAYPNVWWSLANEYDQLVDFERERWHVMAAYIRENDPWQHLLSNHNFVTPWDFSDSNATHVCLQTSDEKKIPKLMHRYGKPVLYDEMGYEGNIPSSWGNLSAYEMVHRFWKVVTMGGYATHGETYMDHFDDDQILWWSKGGTLKGQSIERIRFLRNLLEELPKPMCHLDTSSNFPADKQQLREMMDQDPELQKSALHRCMLNMSDEEFSYILEVLSQAIIHCKEEAYLRYYGNECTNYGSMTLPEDREYKVEVIDVWEMTRKVVIEKVKGRVEIDLPGKPGIAVLATVL